MMKRIKRRLAAAGLLLCLLVFSTSVYAQSEITSEDERTEQTQEQADIKDKDKETSEREETSEDGSDEEETSEDGSEEDEAEDADDPEQEETAVPTKTPQRREAAAPAGTSEDDESAEEDSEGTVLPWQTPTDDETADTQDTTDREETDDLSDTSETRGTDPSDLPPGNLTLAEDVISTKYGNREFLTVYSREGDYFYIIIDRDTEGTGNVWFLNMVDDQDLYSLVGEKYPGRTADKETDKNGTAASTQKICTCVNKCTDENPDASCPVCSEDPSKCKGMKTAADQSGTGEKDTAVQKKPELNLPVLAAGATGLILLILIYALKIRRKDKKAKVPEYNIEDYLMDDDETEEDYDDDNDD